MNKVVTVSDVLSAIDGAINDATGGKGNSVYDIKRKMVESHGLKAMFSIFAIPFITFFMLLYLMSNMVEASTNTSIITSAGLCLAIALISFIIQIKSDKKFREDLVVVADKKVDISRDILDVAYNRISVLADIERRYDLNVQELDNIRGRFYKTSLLMNNFQDINFLNPKMKSFDAKPKVAISEKMEM